MQTLGKKSGTSTPSVTVVIPCHNHEMYVERAVQSVLDQDYGNKRVVVVDDGSTDGSKQKIESMSEELGIDAIYNTFPTGPSAARNAAIQKFWNETDFFCMLDADDTYLPNKISMSVEIIKEDISNIGLVYADVLIQNIENNTQMLELRRPYSREEIEKECIISNTPLINKKALDQVGLYDESMRTAEDWDLWLRITSKFVAIHIPVPLSTYSVTGFNASDTVPSEIWHKNWEKIRDRIRLQKESSQLT